MAAMLPQSAEWARQRRLSAMQGDVAGASPVDLTCLVSCQKEEDEAEEEKETRSRPCSKLRADAGGARQIRRDVGGLGRGDEKRGEACQHGSCCLYNEACWWQKERQGRDALSGATRIRSTDQKGKLF
mmetsp:Transcript_39028/g.83042  ORF Transcript_39028/g.83042 Transcript_39028/m.83042 type:complete len:128 (+) Transcript_39028:2281-2664(+)